MSISMRPKKGVRPGMSKFELELKRATKAHKRKYLAWKPRPRVERRVEEKPAEEGPREAVEAGEAPSS
jgi:hypothetical protein